MKFNQKQLIELNELVKVQIESILDIPEFYEKDALSLWLGIKGEIDDAILKTDLVTLWELTQTR